MAGNSTKQVDLVIRAKDLSQKVLKENEEAIKEVTSALAQQAKQAQKTDASLDELESGLKGLSKVEADAAKNQAALEKAIGSTALTLDRAVARQNAYEAALSRSKGELAAARANAAAAAEAYSEYANSIGKGETVTKKQQRALDELAKAVDKADRAVEKAGSDTIGYTIAQRDAADQTQRLIALQKQYAAAQQAAVAATQQISSAVAAQRTQVRQAAEAQRAADEAEKQAKKDKARAEREEEQARRKNKESLDAFTTGQRESLSWYQRLRGEVIALAASYVGLQGALGLAKDSLDAFQQRQQTQNVLGVAIGSNDTKEIGKEFDYVRGVADRLGFRFKDLAQQYSKFSVASRQAGASAQETRFIFEQVSKATRVLGLSADDSKGVFLALQQMFSKGKISAEELRQQLGERLPGAVAILNKALDLKPGELDKMLEKGAIGADKVLVLARGLGDTFGKNLEPATKSLGAEMGRFQTALDDFKESIANMGFADAFTKFLRDLTTFFKSDEGSKMAANLAATFSKVLDVLRFLVENFTTLKEVLLLIVGIGLAKWFIGVVASAQKAVEWIVKMNAAMVATGAAGATAEGGLDKAAGGASRLAKAVGLVQKALLAVTAFFVGWEIGTILDEKFEVVRKASQLLVNDMLETWVNLKHGFVIVAADISVGVQEAFASAIRGMRNLKNGFIGQLMDGAKKFGLDSLADWLGKGISTGIETGFEDGIDAAKMMAQQARVRRDQELKSMLDVRAHSAVKLTASAKKRIDGGALLPGETEQPGKSTVPVAPPDNSKAVAARERLEERLADKLNALNIRVEKQYKDSLEERLSATKRTFKDIEDTIRDAQKAGVKEVGGVPLSQIRAQVEGLKQQALQQETLKFNTEQLAKAEKTVNDLMEERKNKIAEVTSDQAAGLIDVEEAYRRIAKINGDMVPAIQAAAKGAQDFANAVRSTPGMDTNRVDAFSAKMSRIGGLRANGQGSTTATDGMDAFNRKLQDTNTVLQQRNAEVATYNQLVELGTYTQLEAQQKIKAAYEATQPAINQSVESLRALLASMQAEGNIAPEKFSALNAQLDLLATNAQYADQEMTTLKNAFSGSFTQGFQDFVNAAGDAFAGLINGTKSWGEAFKDLGKVALNALGNIAQAVANAITQMIALRIVSSIFQMGAGAAAGGGAVVGGAIDMTPVVGVPIPHGGGVVGPSGMSGAAGNRTRSVNMGVFRNAPRYHGGGVIGLKSNEQAAILERGEEVLRRDNPRHIMNQTRDAAVAGKDTAIRNILVDDPNRLPDFLQSAQGEKTLVTVLGRNRAKARKALGF